MTTDAATLTLAGELEDPDEVRDAIEAASDDYSRFLRVDLSTVTYLPSLVIGVLFRSMKQAEEAGTEVEVAVASGSIVERIVNIAAMPHVVV